MRIAIFGGMDIEEKEGVEVEHLNIMDYELKGNYDQILVGNALQELNRSQVMAFLVKCYEALNDRGELVLHVPAAEWASKQIFTNTPDNLTYYMLYGEDARPFRACYSMLALRTQVERAKFITRSAGESILKISSTAGDVYAMPVNSIIAVKNIGG